MFRSIIFSSVLSICMSSVVIGDGKTAEPKGIAKAVMWTLENAGVEVTPDYKTQTTDTNQLSSYVKSSIQSVEMLIFLKKEDKSSPLSIPYVSNSVKFSPQAVVVPHLYASPTSDSKRSLIENFESSGVVNNVQYVSLAQLHEIIVGSASPLRNGRLDTYVVSLTGDLSEENEFKAITKSARSSRVMMMVGEDPTMYAPSTHAQYSRVLSSPYSTTHNTTWEGGEFSIYYQGKYLYMTPDIFTGIMTGMFLFLILLIGFNCLGAVQGPATFANKLPPLGKEA